MIIFLSLLSIYFNILQNASIIHWKYFSSISSVCCKPRGKFFLCRFYWTCVFFSFTSSSFTSVLGLLYFIISCLHLFFNFSPYDAIIFLYFCSFITYIIYSPPKALSTLFFSFFHVCLFLSLLINLRYFFLIFHSLQKNPKHDYYEQIKYSS